jgi:hypothetical protein
MDSLKVSKKTAKILAGVYFYETKVATEVLKNAEFQALIFDFHHLKKYAVMWNDLPPEDDDGNNEYKYNLFMLTAQTVEGKKGQMSFRL